ncbi:MAG: hypothetical protein JXK07_13730 [Spirochaetes bacterium]|nr:hypothetical protein [Spirochaetota bacterium]MBN2771894.1 hypothetical protein [Spirochaetota bacterium]
MIFFKKYYSGYVSDYDALMIVVLKRACYDYFVPLRIQKMAKIFAAKIRFFIPFDYKRISPSINIK